jgi:hypothetical protein
MLSPFDLFGLPTSLWLSCQLLVLLHRLSAVIAAVFSIQGHVSGLLDLILFLVMNAVKKLFRAMQFQQIINEHGQWKWFGK